jgi:hypothetical protein
VHDRHKWAVMFEDTSRVGVTCGVESGVRLVNIAANIRKMTCCSYSFPTFVFPSLYYILADSPALPRCVVDSRRELS